LIFKNEKEFVVSKSLEFLIQEISPDVCRGLFLFYSHVSVNDYLDSVISHYVSYGNFAVIKIKI